MDPMSYAQRQSEATIVPVIAVVAYRRAGPLRRLLRSIERAHYSNRPTVFISLEGDASAEVVQIADGFAPAHIDVRVLRNEVRLGLRAHIIKCGDLSLSHGAVIVLEDDLYVDRYFYEYASAALNHYEASESDSVAGVALYAPEYSEYAGLPFRPTANGYSTYPMQVPCSWGQAWTARQWRGFRTWYGRANRCSVDNTRGLPGCVKAWPESSWKKYFAAYLVLNDKYVIYPYESYSTNCSDPGGTHIQNGTLQHQVSLPVADRYPPALRFGPVADAAVAYDPYMEPSGAFVFRALGLDRADVAIDLYGLKPDEELKDRRLVLSPTRYGKPVCCFPRSFRPIEQNLCHPLCGETGGELFLCETSRRMRAKREMTIEALGYYAGFPLLTRRVVTQFARRVPVKLWSKYIRKR